MNENTCQSCKFANALHGLPQTILVCDHSHNAAKSYTAVQPFDRCDNFKRTRSAPLLPRRDPGTRLIPVKGGPFAIVDAADYEMLSKYRWCAKHTPTTCYAIAKPKGKDIAMHRLIMNAPTGLLVDHIDHNGLNNTRKNLRLCTYSQNMQNQKPRTGCTSKYKGVRWQKHCKKFRAGIRHNGKIYDLGYFKDEIKAAKAYDKIAKKLFAQFAYLNFPEE